MRATIADIERIATDPGRTAKNYIASLVAKFEETKNTIITRLSLLGWTQQEVSDKLVELFPGADGVSRVSVTNFLSEMPNLTLLTKNELAKGHDAPTVAKRHGLPEILVWQAAGYALKHP